MKIKAKQESVDILNVMSYDIMSRKNKFWLFVCVCVFVFVATYRADSSQTNCNYDDWDNNGLILLNIAVFAFINFWYTLISVGLALPCGVFAPVFTLGAVIGRWTGELLSQTIKNDYLLCDPRVYAVVGAAAMTGGVTQTISPAVIALEITGELNLSVPVLLAVICACGFSSMMGKSFYDSILLLRGIPLLPPVPTLKPGDLGGIYYNLFYLCVCIYVCVCVWHVCECWGCVCFVGVSVVYFLQSQTWKLPTDNNFKYSLDLQDKEILET